MTRSARTTLVLLVAAALWAPATTARADSAKAWNADEVTAIAAQLDTLVHEIRTKIEIEDAQGDALRSRRTAAARATLAELENSARQFAALLLADGTRETTQPEYERLRGFRVKLSLQATEAGFTEPVMDLIVKARDVLGQLDAYYGFE
jgi:hypothetical protein